MIFSDKTIKEYIGQGKIHMVPAVEPADIRPTGIRLHLASDLLIPHEGQTVDLDSQQDIQFDKIDIKEKSFILKPGQFVLGSTHEMFQVPRDVVCYIEGRSTVARIGLAIHCTSGIIDGNFEEPRTVVLEMKNNGPLAIVLRYKMALAMLTFHQLSTEIEQKTQTQYQSQRGAVAPNIKQQKR